MDVVDVDDDGHKNKIRIHLFRLFLLYLFHQNGQYFLDRKTFNDDV